MIRADGSVVGGSGGLFSGGVESAAMQPGDMVVVPEKIYYGQPQVAKHGTSGASLVRCRDRRRSGEELLDLQSPLDVLLGSA